MKNRKLDGSVFRTTWTAGWLLTLDKNADITTPNVQSAASAPIVRRRKAAAGDQNKNLRLKVASDVPEQCGVLTVLEFSPPNWHPFFGLVKAGSVKVRRDNTSDGATFAFSWPPPPEMKEIAPAQPLNYPQGTRLLVLHNSELMDAEVLTWRGIEHGNRHQLRFIGTSAASKTVDIDLNEANHAMQRFDSATLYGQRLKDYCKQLIQKGEYIEDAITGNKLHVTEATQAGHRSAPMLYAPPRNRADSDLLTCAEH